MQEHHGWWRFECPSRLDVRGGHYRVCRQRLAKFHSNENPNPKLRQEEYTLERGRVLGPDGVYHSSSRWKDRMPVRQRRLGLVERGGPAVTARGVKVVPGVRVHCWKCQEDVEITRCPLSPGA